MKRLIAAAAIIVLAGCDTGTEPVVVTDVNNVIIDMPAGVRWDVVGLDQVTCDLSGGVMNGTTCEGIDF
jgi:ribose 5-phosphate isomerase